ncbi:hypothetical protein NB713_002877 [Xanthomonas sacchari]|nr:hypothetical protein [Xanthomonas sacchari]
MRAAQAGTVDHHATAQAVIEVQIGEVAVLAADAEQALARRRHRAIVVHPHRQAQRLGQPVADRQLAQRAQRFGRIHVHTVLDEETGHRHPRAQARTEPGTSGRGQRRICLAQLRQQRGRLGRAQRVFGSGADLPAEIQQRQRQRIGGDRVADGMAVTGIERDARARLAAARMRQRGADRDQAALGQRVDQAHRRLHGQPSAAAQISAGGGAGQAQAIEHVPLVVAEIGVDGVAGLGKTRQGDGDWSGHGRRWREDPGSIAVPRVVIAAANAIGWNRAFVQRVAARSRRVAIAASQRPQRAAAAHPARTATPGLSPGTDPAAAAATDPARSRTTRAPRPRPAPRRRSGTGRRSRPPAGSARRARRRP